MDYKEQDLNQIIFDFSLESKQRMKTLKLISIEKLPEIINRLISIHLFSNTSVVEEFLSEICLETKIPIIFRLQCSVLLCKKNTEKSFDILNKVLKNKDTVALPIRFNAILILMSNENFKNNVQDFLNEIILNNNYDKNIILKLIFSIQNIKSKYKNDFMINSLNKLIYLENTNSKIKILSIQKLFLLKEKDFDEEEDYIKILINIAEHDKDYNTKSDAADSVLHLSKNKQFKKKALKVINYLGTKGKICSIYNNKQNIHSNSIKKSVEKIIEKINYIKPFYNFEQIKKILLDTFDQKIINALNRIEIDSILHSKYNCTLKHIFVRLFQYIINSKHKKEMLKRLKEELVEMEDTCSSGFCHRLINSITGFGDFSIRITNQEKMFALFTSKLNKRIINLENDTENRESYIISFINSESKNNYKSLDEYCKLSKFDKKLIIKKYLNESIEFMKEKILTEMIIDPKDYLQRQNFLTFLRNNILLLQEDLWQIFKDDDTISDDQFVLFFRQSLSKFEDIIIL